jgi:hypothetical protein
MSCDLYKNEGHNYLEYLLAQLDERASQVNSINNESSFMPNPSYIPYPKDLSEFQKWIQERQNSKDYGNYNHSYQNNQGK